MTPRRAPSVRPLAGANSRLRLVAGGKRRGPRLRGAPGASGGAAMNRRKTGRPRIEDRAKTNEARKPWLALSMSRRTWYRRQAEQRKGQE